MSLRAILLDSTGLYLKSSLQFLLFLLPLSAVSLEYWNFVAFLLIFPPLAVFAVLLFFFFFGELVLITFITGYTGG